MLMVYHVDGGRLLLTHYCLVGNQPRMQAKAYNAGTSWSFSISMPPTSPPARVTCIMSSFASWTMIT